MDFPDSIMKSDKFSQFIASFHDCLCKCMPTDNYDIISACVHRYYCITAFHLIDKSFGVKEEMVQNDPNDQLNLATGK